MYERLVGQLNDVFGRGVTPDNAEAAEKIRELVAKAVVVPSGDGFAIQLQGRLALLMDAPNVYPNMRIPPTELLGIFDRDGFFG